MNPFSHTGLSISDSLKYVRKSVLIYETIIYDRVVRVLGENVVEDAVQKDIQEQKALEEKRQIEQMPKGSIHERLAWGARKSEMENQQRKKNKTKNRGMER